MEIIRLDLWDDPGFTQGGIRQPGMAFSMPTPDLTINEPLHPSWEDIYATLKITRSDANTTVDFLDLQTKSYLRAVCEFNSGNTLTLYGWITGAECRSDSDTPMTILTWTVDYWNTYKSLAEFRYGVVRRSTRYQFPQNFAPQKWVPDTAYSIILPQESGYADSYIWWLYFTRTIQNQSGDTVYTEQCCMPFVMSPDYGNYSTPIMTISGPTTEGSSAVSTAATMNIQQVLNNMFDELLGINPATINYAGICPYPPCRFIYDTNGKTGYLAEPTGTGHNGSWLLRRNNTAGTSYFGYYTNLQVNNCTSKAFTERAVDVDWSGSAGESNDWQRWVVTGWNNELIGEVPFRYSFTDMTYRIILNQTSAYVEIRQNTDIGQVGARSAGMCFTIPLIQVTVSENSLSEYVYSGQEEFDRESLRLANLKALSEGVIDATANAVDQAAWAGPLAPLVGGATLTTGLLSTAGKYALNEAVFDPQQLSITKSARARQTDALLMAGENALDIARFCDSGLLLIRLEMDAVSNDRYVTMVSYMGYESPMLCVNQQIGEIPTLVTLISQGGPLQIAQLDVGGAIPPIAKQYIADMFDKGVYLL